MFIELCTKLSLMIQGHLKEDVYIKSWFYTQGAFSNR